MVSSLDTSSVAVEPSGYVTIARPASSVATVSPPWMTRSSAISTTTPARESVTCGETTSRSAD